MTNESLWRATATPPNTADARADARAELPTQIDVAIIGGGITGLTAAYLLKREGKRVAVFERDTIGLGETGSTSAHLTYNTDLRIKDIANEFGEQAARLFWEGHANAIDLIELLVKRHSIDCGFERVPGYSCSSFTEDRDESDDMKENAELAQKLGFQVSYVENGPVTGKPAVEFAEEALFHPLKYLNALAEAVRGDGSFVFEQCEVSEVLQDPLTVVVNAQNIACTDVIIATHVAIVGSTGTASAMLFQTKLYPYSSYVVGARITGDIAPGLYSDTSDPYNYLRVHRDDAGLYAVFGGQDHKTGTETNTEERFAKVEALLLNILPSSSLEYRWSGQVVETDDGLPFIGQTAEHQYAATGYAGNGLTNGTLAAMMMRDAILGVEHPLKNLLDPNRKASSLSALGTLVTEAASFPYYMVRDRLRRNKEANADSVEAGDGKVLTIDGKRVACHRKDDGTLLKVSAVCTHLGCLVRWNNAERSWDCPCHGSRFTPEGLVIGGPAETPLEAIND